ncbi:N-succinylarginine dihydrolase [Planctomicrobium sp. SH668]|uniref:N-succinylarginine dihydrolase n=1 Tax=Planctomicrobium sp. SH668 TaxID=3448126 RepID=UPI003F5BE6D2
MTAFEVNFDGLIGPTHHYGGLAEGNLASFRNRHRVSHPKAAALEGLNKMKLLMDLGVKQGVLPPQPRPHWGFLQERGFTGRADDVIAQAARERPDLLSIAYSASSMWTANAATVSPSSDTEDGKVHFTPANLISTTHRQLEAVRTTEVLRQIFSNQKYFVVHDPLQSEAKFADEGAANHIRLCETHGAKGIEIFVFGNDDEDANSASPMIYSPRQTLSASRAVARRHKLRPDEVLFLKQNPDAIDAGVFHNDVVAFGNERHLVCHEQSFVNQNNIIKQLRDIPNRDLKIVTVETKDLSLEEAVATYLFNSQLVTIGSGEDRTMTLIAPIECERSSACLNVIDQIQVECERVTDVQFVDVRQSMRNGGGPACLRLRVVLTEEELNQLSGTVLLTPQLYEGLRKTVINHYRDELDVDALRDPQLAVESNNALAEIYSLLGLNWSPDFP